MVNLDGFVVDINTHNPLVNAVVTVNEFTLTTNGNGKFIVSLPTANYSVTISRLGYSTQTFPVLLTENSKVLFQLVPMVGLL